MSSIHALVVHSEVQGGLRAQVEASWHDIGKVAHHLRQRQFTILFPSMETLKEKRCMKKKTLTVSANGMDFYCEMMGQGPTMVLVPPGSDDIAALVREIPLEKPVSAFGVSSGGQAVLALAKFHPDLTRNGIVHEAALQADTPIKNTGFEYFQRIATFSPKIADSSTAYA